MSDKELLEFAAKAAEKDWFKHTDGGLWLRSGGIWNPLTDDGDAFRLAVDLKLFVHLDGDLVEVIGDKSVFERAGYKGCRLSAARRAIVRAAAEIGKAMP